MGLSRKNKRQLKALRKDANVLWAEQQKVLNHAQKVAARAGGTAINLSDQHLAPRVNTFIDKNVRPSVERGLDIASNAAANSRDVFDHRVMPWLVGSAGSVAGAAQSLTSRPEVKKAVKKAQKARKQIEKNTSPFISKYVMQAPQKKKKNKLGAVLLIGLGVAVAGGVAYALYQTFRADDDLWISDEELDTPQPIKPVEPKPEDKNDGTTK